jgi:hypothetical protein
MIVANAGMIVGRLLPLQEGEALQAKLLTKDEARRIAINVARLGMQCSVAIVAALAADEISASIQAWVTRLVDDCAARPGAARWGAAGLCWDGAAAPHLA